MIPTADLPRAKVLALELPHGRARAIASRPGETIAGLVARERLAAGLPLVCSRVEGEALVPVLRADWARPIDPVERLVFVTMPLGGGGGGGGGGGSRSIGGLVAMIAVIAVAAMIAGPAGAGLASSLGFGNAAVFTQIIQATIVAAGALLISHFLAPKKGAVSAPEYSLALSGNQPKPQQPIPVQYGRLKFNPDFAIPPWGEYSGLDQIYHALYCLGAGDFDIEEIGVDTTPIWTKSGGVAAGFAGVQVQICGPGVPVTLFPTNVFTSSDIAGQQLPDPYGTTYSDGSSLVGPNGERSGPNFVGPFALIPAGTTTNWISLDFVFPAGLFAANDDGSTGSASAAIQVDIQPIDDQGVPVAGALWQTIASLGYAAASTAPVRKTAQLPLPNQARYRIRAARLSARLQSKGANDVTWTGAKASIGAPSTFPKVTTLALTLVADKLLSSYSSKQIYCVATRKIPVWTGAAFVEQATQNPIHAAVDIWRNGDYGGGLPETKIDLFTMSALAAGADARGETFNHRFTQSAFVLEMIQTALRPMLAAPVYLLDTFSAVRDDPRPLPRLLLTDFEIIRGSLQIGYTLSDLNATDGVIVEYFDENIWQPADVGSVADFTTLQKPARIQVPGVTQRAQAARLARYTYAENKYRRVTATLDVEAEGKLLRRGDLVAVSSELPTTWGASLRVEAFDAAALGLTLHTGVDWSGSGPWYMRLRAADGTPFGPVKVTRGGADSIALVDSMDLALVQTAQVRLLADVLTRRLGEDAPTAAFSPAQPREFQGLVTRMAALGENRFRLDLVKDAPEVYAALTDSAVLPLPTPPSLILPSAPAAPVGLGATLVQRAASLVLGAAWQPDPAAARYTAAISYDAGASWVTVYDGAVPSFQIAGLGGNDLHVRVRGTSALGVVGPWGEIVVTSPGLNLALDNLGITVKAGDLDASVLAALTPVVVADQTAQNIGAKIVLAAGATADGAAAAIALQVQAGNAGSPAVSGLTIELFETSPGSGLFTARTVVDAQQFFIRNGGTGFVPFGVSGNDVLLQGITRVSNPIRSNSSNAAGVPFMQVDFENGKITISDNT